MTWANAAGAIRAPSSVRDRCPCRPELRDNPRHVDGIPDEHGVGQPAEARRLVHDLGVIAGLKRPLIGKQAPARARVPPLTTIALELHPSAERLLVQVASERDRAQRAA